MSADRFHLAWFLSGSNAQGWRRSWSGNVGGEWARPDLYQSVARELERAGFDYILLEDNVYIPDAYHESMEIYLKHAISVPRVDPVIMAPWMLQATSRIGIVPTMSTFAYHPYLLARLMGSLDTLSGGRAGWNMVTGSSDRAVQNFGLDAMAEHDLRYEMAAEFCDVTNALWDSWEPGAIVNDAATGTFADHTKVRTIDFKGRWYASRGPLNSGPLPQGRPVMAQAGSSRKGREFAAKYSDTIVVEARDLAYAKKYRDDVRELAAGFGRKPDDIKLMLLINPIVGASQADADERHRLRDLQWAEDVEDTLATLSKMTSIDFGQFPLDEPLSTDGLTTNGTQATLTDFIRQNEGRTLREAATGAFQPKDTRLTGTAASVADEMQEIVSEVGGDGFLFAANDVSRRSIAEITDGLVPELQRRGLVRTVYAHETFRDNLLEY